MGTTDVKAHGTNPSSSYTNWLRRYVNDLGKTGGGVDICQCGEAWRGTLPGVAPYGCACTRRPETAWVVPIKRGAAETRNEGYSNWVP